MTKTVFPVGWDPTEIRSRPQRKVVARVAVLNGHWLSFAAQEDTAPTLIGPQSRCLKFRNTFRHGRDVLRAHRPSTESDSDHRSAAISPVPLRNINAIEAEIDSLESAYSISGG